MSAVILYRVSVSLVSYETYSAYGRGYIIFSNYGVAGRAKIFHFQPNIYRDLQVLSYFQLQPARAEDIEGYFARICCTQAAFVRNGFRVNIHRPVVQCRYVVFLVFRGKYFITRTLFIIESG